MEKIKIKSNKLAGFAMSKEEIQRHHEITKKSHHIFKNKKKFDKKKSRNERIVY